MVGVECDEDIVFFGEGVNRIGEDDGTFDGIIDGGAGCELAASGGNLDDPVGLGLGEGAEGSVDGGERGDVDGRVGVAAFLGGIEHGGVLFWRGDWHD